MIFQLLIKNSKFIVQLYRFVVRWEDNEEWCVSSEQRDEVITRLKQDEIPYIVKDIDQTDNEWIDGIEFLNREEADEALNMGETLWRKSRPRTMDEICQQLDDLQSIIKPIVIANFKSDVVFDKEVVDIAIRRGLVERE